ncbi:MAG: hypothetical protein DRG78_05920 [Epsilonproteobacteria bacterium]|nr:MAG: hypothetical protein DRG78_05920 [Campylobacterota bacterium]
MIYNFNIKFIASIIFLFTLVIIISFMPKEVMLIIRWLLESGTFNNILTISIWIVILAHSFTVDETNLTQISLFNTQIKLIDTLLLIATYVTVASTASSLLKGAYIQQFYNDTVYFNEFDKLDIYLLIGVPILLLWYIILNISKMFKEALFFTTQASSPKNK